MFCCACVVDDIVRLSFEPGMVIHHLFVGCIAICQRVVQVRETTRGAISEGRFESHSRPGPSFSTLVFRERSRESFFL